MSRDVIMPALGMAQTTGLIVAWRKQQGDAVKAGDVLMEVETDKAVMEVAAEADGFLIDVSAAAGEDVPVGDVIARIADSPGQSSTPAALAAPVAAPAVVSAAPAERPLAKPASAAPPPPPPPRRNGRIFASPRARRLAAEQGLDLSKLAARGEAQPYLVKHLTALRALPAEATSESVAAAPALRLTASVTGDGFAEFCAWRRTETGAPPEEIAVIAGMAAASYRPSVNGASLVVSAQAFGRTRSFVDPDHTGLGAAKASEPAATPSLVLRDLRGARVTDLHLGGEAAPVLTVMQRGAELFVTLECAPARLQPEAAIALISEFAGRLAEPLRHLL